MLAWKLKIASCLLAACVAFAALADKPGGKTVVEYFFQSGCEECQKINALILPRLEEQYSGRYELRQYDLARDENFLLLITILDRLRDDSNHSVYLVLDRQTALGGYPAIAGNLFEAMEQRLSAGGIPRLGMAAAVPDELAAKWSGRMTLAAVIIAGLLDGVNPCVFSTLVFFMSLLTVAKISGKRLLLVGIVYCLACFLTYLLLGFGLFKIIRALTVFTALKPVLNRGMSGVLIVLAILSFRDAWRYAAAGEDADKVLLQLPSGVKKRIRDIMRRGLKNRYLLGGVFCVGALVTLLESVCTGQVYVPTLLLLARESGDIFSKWFGLLLLYNVMFILPLIGVFALVYGGLNTLQAVRLTRGNLLIVKLLLGTFLVVLALLLILT